MYIFVQSVDLFIRRAPSKFTREVNDEERSVMWSTKVEICPCTGEDGESELNNVFATLICSSVLATIALTDEVRDPKSKAVVTLLVAVEVDVGVFVVISVVRGWGGAVVRSGGAVVRSGGVVVRVGGVVVRDCGVVVSSGGAVVRSGGGAVVRSCGVVVRGVGVVVRGGGVVLSAWCLVRPLFFNSRSALRVSCFAFRSYPRF